MYMIYDNCVDSISNNRWVLNIYTYNITVVFAKNSSNGQDGDSR